MTGAGMRGTPAGRDARAVAWLTAPEDASSRRVLDATFAELGSIRQERWRPWMAVRDGLSRPASIELPRWAWIAVALLLMATITIATLTVASRVRPWFERLSALPAAPAALTDVPCPADFAVAGEVRCRMASVPSRHEDASGPTVRLLVAEFEPTGASVVPGAEPLLASIALDPAGERTIVDFAAVAQSVKRPVIAVAPRGTRLSDPSLACPEVESLATPADPSEMTGAAWRGSLGDAVRACRDRLASAGIDVAAFGLAEQAADLESIRRALGIDRWVMRTFGDESRLALELIRRYPDHVAGVVLVGPSFPGEDPAQVTADAVPAAIDGVTAMCDADPFCAGRYRRSTDAYAAAMAGDRSQLVARAVRSALVGTAAVATLPSHLDRVANGDPGWASDLFASQGWCLGYQLSCSSTTGWTGGGEFSTACLGRVQPATAPARNGGADPFGVTGLVGADPWPVICDAWVGDARDASTTGSVASDVPVVAISIGVDPFHSLAATTAGMQNLSRGVLRTAVWAPEGASGRCLAAGESAWIEDPQAALPAACPQLVPIPFADAP